MTKRTSLAAVAITLCALPMAYAQQPATGDPAPVASPSYGLPITLAQAKLLAASVEAQALKANERDMVIAIVSPDGELVYFSKMDDATYVSIQLAQSKAVMAARYRMASGNLPPSGATGLPDAIVLKGGLPIVYQGKTIGAIGVTGAEANDVVFGQTAIDALNKTVPK
ncbi:MAG: heme-binding protein [Steroidobacteraceae bacterium]